MTTGKVNIVSKIKLNPNNPNLSTIWINSVDQEKL